MDNFEKPLYVTTSNEHVKIVELFFVTNVHLNCQTVNDETHYM